MLFIKKLVMYGFKSFPRKTELPFTPEINVIIGANGSGKSNISDALCFVLGRLSSKSLRAAKSGNLIFLGTKSVGPSKEASVELVFDNSDSVFSIDSNEVSIKRIVRKNGQSIYKINDETKTRQEVLFLLAQAGIDSQGFNIILQGEIQNFVRMPPLERRGIIEEVSGISIYEIRKEKSLKELEKTENKLKEIQTILRERTAYLNNLEKQRQQALKYKKIEEQIKKFKASIIFSDLSKRRKELEKINFEVSEKSKEIEKTRKIISEIMSKIESYESKINSINLTIQKSTGFEQDNLNREIANLRAEMSGMGVKIEHYENKLSEISREKSELEKVIKDNESSIKDLQKSPSGTLTQKHRDIEEKKREIEKLQGEVKKFYSIKSELKSIKERINDKKNLIQNYLKESEFILSQINQLSIEIFDSKTDRKKVDSLKKILEEKADSLKKIIHRETELEKISYRNEHEISKHRDLKQKISKIDICPVCKSKITQNHIHAIHKEADDSLLFLEEEIKKADKELSEINEKKSLFEYDIEQLKMEIQKRESDIIKLMSVGEKKNQLKTLHEKTEKISLELKELERISNRLEKTVAESSSVEQRYETSRIELQEISIRSNENVNAEVSFKQKELERAKISFKQSIREEEELKEDLNEHKKLLDEKDDLLSEKREQEEELSRKFEKLISERDDYQKKIRETEMDDVKNQNLVHNIEQEINRFNIEKAEINAKIENLETDFSDFIGIEIIKSNREELLERLEKAKQILISIGSVNLLSLEIYDSVKKDYDSVKEKSDIIEKEKEEILKIINEIDTKKKRTFLKTLNELNEIFSRNFSSLSAKGMVSLELEDKKEPFATESGIRIIVKTGHGKYFDVTSLSGGEQTLVALSLIFAIQEYKPYSFYILDEIDAALDKRNSARLAELLKKYMKKGQYIVITHNDEIISNANILYGVSMHEGVSKIVSLKV
ncbi:chromosome segregation protein SMC [Candidatus Pacearchaeota archaeon]|nr:chromosome segregation protein SMC [Candidatus Pacearchaeota archaeon]